MAHIHSVVDTDIHYKIDGITRTIVNVNETKKMLVQNDHNSERLTFEMPRYIDGHDMTTCNVVQVHYVNSDMYEKNASYGVYDVDDLGVRGESGDDANTVILTWLVSNKATKYVGTLNFVIRFSCVTEEKVDYAWNTTTFKGINIVEGIFISEKVIEEHPDILEQHETRLKALEEDGHPTPDWMATKTKISGGELVKELSLSFAGTVAAISPSFSGIENGVEYDVYWNGELYTCTASISGLSVYLGNKLLMADERPQPGEPFLLYGTKMPNQSAKITTAYKNDANEETVSVRIETHAVYEHNTMPDEYIPKSIDWVARKRLVAGEVVWEKKTLTLDSKITALSNNGGQFDVVEHNKYDVYWNDVRYVCDAKKFDGQCYLGNGKLAFSADAMEDTGEPFCFLGSLFDVDRMVALYKETEDTQIVTVLVKASDAYEYDKIPSGYLPNGHLMAVTVTKNEDNDRYTANHTVAEIEEWCIKGGVVILIDEKQQYVLDYVAGSQAFFRKYYPLVTGVETKVFTVVDGHPTFGNYARLQGGVQPYACVSKAEVGQVIQVDRVDTSGKPTKWKAVDCQPRTHYDEIVDVVHVPEVTTRCDVTEEQEGYTCAAPGEVIEGGTYKVVFDGATYSVQLKKVDFEGMGTFYAIGNAKVMADIFAQLEVPGIEAVDTGEPFIAMAVYSDYDKTYTWMIATADSDMHTLNITGPMRVLTKIDNKYISPNVVEEFMDNTVEVGSLCKMNLAGQLDKCDPGETFIGLCLRKFNHFGTAMAEVQIAGYITVPYTGVTPPCGYTKLVANGQGGVKVDVDGREYFVTRFDSVEGVIDIRL